jgi:hypothetical protein
MIGFNTHNIKNEFFRERHHEGHDEHNVQQ